MSLDLLIPYTLITGGGAFSKHSPTVNSFPLVTNTTPDNVILTEKVGDSDPGMYQWNGNLFRWQFIADYETVTSQLFGLANAIICLMPGNTSLLPIGSSGTATITVYRNGVQFSDYTVTSQGIQLTRPSQENDTYLVLQVSSLGATSTPGVQDAPNDGNNYVRKSQAWNLLSNVTPTELGASTVGASIFTADSASDVVTLLDVIPTSQIGTANGVAPLDSSSKIPIANIPGAVLGAVTFQGVFTPGTSTLPAAAPGNKGWYYVTSAAGTYTPPSGTLLTFSAGDYLISDGTQWAVIDTQDSVISVNGKTGAVVLGAGDITTGVFGGAQIGTNNANNTLLIIDSSGNNTWVAIVPTANLPVATNSNPGVVSIGTGLTVTGSSLAANVTTVAGRTGDVVLAIADVSGAAPLANPVFTGNVDLTGANATATTQPANTNNTTIASTEYADRAATTAAAGVSYTLPSASTSILGGIKVGTGVSATGDGTLSAAVTSVAGRTGAITLAIADITGGAPLASPTFTGNVDLTGATTLVVTQTSGTNNTTAASTAFVNAAITASAYTLPAATSSTLGGIKQGSGVTIAGDGTLAATPYAATSYAKCRWVSEAIGSDSNDGTSIERPWQTLTKAAASVTGSGITVFVAPGNYSAPVSWTAQNCDIVGMCSRSNVVNVTGQFTFNHTASSVRCSNIGFVGGITLANAGALYLTNCQVNGFSKTGAGYFEAADCDMENASISITGAGNTTLFAGKYSTITVNNATALVAISNALRIAGPVQLTAGTLRIEGSVIITTGTQDTAITTNSGSTLILSRVDIYDSTGTPTVITTNGNWTVGNVLYNQANSTGTGTNLQSPFYFDSVQALSSVKTGTLTATGLITPTYPAGIKANITGNNVTAGSVGEYLEVLTSNVALTSGSPPTSTATLALTPGDWDIQAFCTIVPVSPASITQAVLELTSTPQVFLQGDVGTFSTMSSAGVDGLQVTLKTATIRVNSNASVSINSSVGATWTGAGTASVTTKIRARRS